MKRTAAPGKMKSGGGKARLVPYEEVRSRILADPAVRLEYDRLKIRRELGRAVLEARQQACLTQAQVAERAGTRQSVIARLEGGKGGIPSLGLLERVAAAIGLRLFLTLQKEAA